MTNPAVVDVNGIEWTGRFVGWGRGKWHIQRTGKPQVTVCGRDVPEEVRYTIHHPLTCARCEADAEAFKAAEDYRLALAQLAASARQKRIDANRAGRFIVHRCKKCGTQHSAPRYGQGVPYCLAEHHEADLEELEAQGPAWSPTAEGEKP